MEELIHPSVYLSQCPSAYSHKINGRLRGPRDHVQQWGLIDHYRLTEIWKPLDHRQNKQGIPAIDTINWCSETKRVREARVLQKKEK